MPHSKTIPIKKNVPLKSLKPSLLSELNNSGVNKKGNDNFNKTIKKPEKTLTKKKPPPKVFKKNDIISFRLSNMFNRRPMIGTIKEFLSDRKCLIVSNLIPLYRGKSSLKVDTQMIHSVFVPIVSVDSKLTVEEATKYVKLVTKYHFDWNVYLTNTQVGPVF